MKKHCLAKVLLAIWEKFLNENNRNYNSYRFSYKFAFVLYLGFLTNQKQESDFQQVGGLVTRNISVFVYSGVALYFKAMPNLIDFYKRIFFHVIPVRIIVPSPEPFAYIRYYFHVRTKFRGKLTGAWLGLNEAMLIYFFYNMFFVLHLEKCFLVIYIFNNLINFLSALKQTFSEFDKDADGYISKEELFAVMSDFGHGVTENEVDRIMTRVDTDGKCQKNVVIALKGIF